MVDVVDDEDDDGDDVAVELSLKIIFEKLVVEILGVTGDVKSAAELIFELDE